MTTALQRFTPEEYLLVSQNEPMAETFTRQPDGTWLFSAYWGLSAIAALRSLQIEIPLSEAYAGLAVAGSSRMKGTDIMTYAVK
jgi:hypothetical protein